MDDLSEYRENLRIAEILGGDSDDLIYVGSRQAQDLFTPAKLDALRGASRALESLPEVKQAISFVDLPSASTKQRLSIGETAARAAARQQLLSGKVPTGNARSRLYWPISKQQQSQIEMEDLRSNLLHDNRVAGTLLSASGECWGIVLKLSSGREIPITRQIRLRDEIVDVIRDHDLGSEEIYTTGLIISQGWLFKEMFKGIYLIGPLVLLAISTTVYLIFRHAATVIIAMTIAILATVWAIGFTIFCFGEISMIVVAAAPPVIITISTSDFIHLTSTYRDELDAGHSIPDALEKTICEVGGACVLTSLTTMIGFASLATVPVPATRDFAIAAAVGVIAAFFLQTLGPIVYLRMQVHLSNVSDRLQKGMLAFFDSIVNACRFVSIRYPYWIMTASGVLITIVFISATEMRFSSDFPKRFPEGHSLRNSGHFFNQEFSGSSHIELLLRMVDQNATEPAVLQYLASIEKEIQEISDVRAVHSILTPLRSLGKMLRFQSEDALPPTQPAIDASVRLIELHDESAIRGFVSLDRKLLRVYVQVSPTDFMEVAAIAARIEAITDKLLPADGSIQARCTGTMTMVGRCIQRIIDSQLRGNWICLIAITIIMAMALQSWRISLLAQIPNLIPLSILVGLLVWSFESIDNELLGLPMIALGIAVDDTIHFLHRYRLQLAMGENRHDALESTFQFTGRAVVQSALILCVGLVPCALSEYLGVRMMGTMLVFTLACGLLADLLLIPALIETGVIRWKDQG